MKKTQGIVEINQDNYATFSRMQEEIFLYRIRKYLQMRRYHSRHAQEEAPKKSNSIKEAQPPLQNGFSKTHTNAINPTQGYKIFKP